MDEEHLEAVGQLVDKCENLLAAATLPVSPTIHLKGLTGGLEEIRDELKRIYQEAGGEEF